MTEFVENYMDTEDYGQLRTKKGSHIEMTYYHRFPPFIAPLYEHFLRRIIIVGLYAYRVVIR